MPAARSTQDSLSHSVGPNSSVIVVVIVLPRAPDSITAARFGPSQVFSAEAFIKLHEAAIYLPMGEGSTVHSPHMTSGGNWRLPYHGEETGGTGRDLPLRAPLISFPGWDPGGGGTNI